MPYYVFQILPDKNAKLLNTFDKFKDAKERCRELRKSESPDNPNLFRMAFAENEHEAKRLIIEKHEPSSPLEEWEA